MLRWMGDESKELQAEYGNISDASLAPFKDNYCAGRAWRRAVFLASPQYNWKIL